MSSCAELLLKLDVFSIVYFFVSKLFCWKFNVMSSIHHIISIANIRMFLALCEISPLHVRVRLINLDAT